jgi:hypothetical protein
MDRRLENRLTATLNGRPTLELPILEILLLKSEPRRSSLLPLLSTVLPGEFVGECVEGPTLSSSEPYRSKDIRFEN